MSNRLVLIFILMALFCSCGLQQRPKSSSRIAGVPLADSKSDSRPKINDDNSGPTVGPTIPEEAREAISLGSNQVIAAHIGPGINRVLISLSFLKKMSFEKRPIHIISGKGLGAVVAALYAAGKTPDRIEWLFYNFLRKTRKTKVYSEEWLSKVNEVLLRPLEKIRIQELNKVLIVPLFDGGKKKIIYAKTGSLVEILRQNLTLTGNGIRSALEWYVPLAKIYNDLGATKSIALDLLGENIEWGDRVDYLYGIFGRAHTVSRKEYEELGVTVRFKVDKMPLDTQNKIPEFLAVGQKESVQAVKMVSEYLDKKN